MPRPPAPPAERMHLRLDEAGHWNGVYAGDAAISFSASPILRWFFTSAI
ncbi:MAG: hypothetical protein ACYCZN_15395 [Candidatus Dormibacteria bacterium]